MVLISEVKSVIRSWLKSSSYLRTGVDHSCCMIPVSFHLASVKWIWVLVKSDRTVMSGMKRRGRPIIVITQVTTATDWSRIEFAVCKIIYK